MKAWPKNISMRSGWARDFRVAGARTARERPGGIESPAGLENWMVHVTGNTDRHIPLSAITELPAHEITTEFKCVEGWSRVVNWKGVRLADFLDKFGGPSQYIGLSTTPDGTTPDGQLDRYYVGLDRPSACIRKRCCATR